ncbi:MAG: DUF4355 domain-containing protein [Enterococcus gallinarum]|uniref:DUF4355 domain-containing protein n=1 Tax=Enterococcus gallinarum TaxID=1353 RepID=UPI000987D68F|nr:DUF4355 domain-containing protein [Enterococcus gallinarum]MCI5684568.1 DUF4355 domain-containing protein [Enterococcus gallinarum]MCO5478486.1 DUF4355 domain-containing protein [Enterococcus gallinarum]MDY4070994.1 DUF4355 domain-containing protein [Enterococcus gallinarum]OOG28451.1 phage capsid protein [Enterococcus casseliflavus]
MKTNKKLLMPLNLQFFADDNDEDNPGDQTPEFDAENLTDEQLAAIKEKFGFKDDKEVDSIVNSRRARWQKEAEERENEAARLAKLSEKDRQKALFDKEREDFEKEKENFRKEQLLVEKGKQLTAQGIPADFAHRITGETAEEILEDVKTFRSEWDKAVETKVNERLASKTKTKVGTTSGQMTKAEIMAIKDTKERQRMIAANRELF